MQGCQVQGFWVVIYKHEIRYGGGTRKESRVKAICQTMPSRRRRLIIFIYFIVRNSSSSFIFTVDCVTNIALKNVTKNWIGSELLTLADRLDIQKRTFMGFIIVRQNHCEDV